MLHYIEHLLLRSQPEDIISCVRTNVCTESCGCGIERCQAGSSMSLACGVQVVQAGVARARPAKTHTPPAASFYCQCCQDKHVCCGCLSWYVCSCSLARREAQQHCNLAIKWNFSGQQVLTLA